jgi:hypothetical protein
MSHIGKIETFKPIYDGSLGIPGLGVAPAMPKMDAALARLLMDRAPDYDDPEVRRAMRNLCFTTAGSYFTPMNNIVANVGGAVQNLPGVFQHGGRQRTYGGSLTYAAQAAASVIGLCRLPLFGVIVGITLVTSVSTGSATLAIGDANSSNVYVAASAYTSADTPTRIGKTSAHFAQLMQGYDATTGNPTNFSSGQNAAPPNPGGFGSLYEDVLVTTAAASLPGSGTLVILVDYVID